MAGKIADLFVNIGAKTDDLKKGLGGAKTDVNSFQSEINNIGTKIAAAFAVGAVVAFGAECIKVAIAAEGIEMAFKRIGTQSDLEDLRKQTKGTVNDLELMKAAVQANNFGIPLKQLGSLLAFAHQRAKDTGQSVDYLVNSIVMGIGRKSPLILDNLGISAVALKEKMKGISTEAATVGDVANAVGQIASESMVKIGESTLTAKDQIDKASAAWENWKLSLGKTSLNVLVSGFNALNTELEKLAKTITMENVSKWDKFTALLERVVPFMRVGGAKLSDDMIKLNDALKATATIQAGEIMQGVNAHIKGLGDVQKATDYINDTFYSLIRQYGEMQALQKKKGKLSNEEYVTMQKIEKLIIEITRLRKNPSEVDSLIFGKTGGAEASPERMLGLLEAAKKKVEDLKKAVEQSPTETLAAKFSRDLVKAQSDLLTLEKQIRNSAFGTGVGEGLSPMKAKGTGSLQGGDVGAQGTAKMDEFVSKYDGMKNAIVESNEQISVSMSDFAVGFAEDLGSVIAGTGTLGDAFLNAMTGFMSQLGQQMIAVGFAKTVLDKLLLTPGGGVIAIGAGMALVALAGAARATMASGVGGGGSSGGSSSSAAMSSSGSNNMTVQIEGVVSGSDLRWVQKNYNKRLGSTTSIN